MSSLGRSGQWGNQVTQYAYIRTCALRYGCIHQVPPWAGQYFFGHQDPKIDRRLPFCQEHYGDTEHQRCFGYPTPLTEEEVVSHDWTGWGQYHTSWYAPDREFLLGLYQTIPPELHRVKPVMDALRSNGSTVVALHIRRSDAGRMIFFLTPVTWYLRWLRENWGRLHKPILYIAHEDESLVDYFREYDPWTMERIGIVPRTTPPNYTYPYGKDYTTLRQLDFFPDWYVMQQADIVVGSDSTFSFTAAWLSRQNKEYWRARLSTQRFELVDPWNGDFSWREHLDDYPGIPGTQLDDNPTYGNHWANYTPKHPSVPIDPEELKELMQRRP